MDANDFKPQPKMVSVYKADYEKWLRLEVAALTLLGTFAHWRDYCGADNLYTALLVMDLQEIERILLEKTPPAVATSSFR